MMVPLLADRFLLLRPVTSLLAHGASCLVHTVGRVLDARIHADAARGVLHQPDRRPEIVHARDVATQRSVLLVLTARGESEECGGRGGDAAWRDRCARFMAWRHRALARLVDYGPLTGYGTFTSFEAWRGAPWHGSAAQADVVRANVDVERWLDAAALSAGPGACVARWSGRPVVVPDVDAGHPTGGRVAPLALVHAAIDWIDRVAVRTLVDFLLTGAVRCRPVVALWGPSSSGLHLAVLRVAHEARRAGFVPIAADEPDPRVWATLADRSTLVIDHREWHGRDWPDRRDPVREGHQGWRRFLEVSTGGVGSTALLLVRRQEVRGVCNLPLEPVPADLLVAALQPAGAFDADEDRIRRMARASGGWPGRFAARVWQQSADQASASRSWGTRVAEPPATYAMTPQTASVSTRTVRARPASAEIERLRGRLHAAIQALASGHHVTAERAVRTLVAALARRRAFGVAAEGWLALARFRVRRGQVAAARSALQEARAAAQRAEDEALLLEVTCIAGVASADAGALGDAESVLRGALATARARHPARVHLIQGALSRALFWQGRYDEAAQAARVAADADGESVEMVLGHLGAPEDSRARAGSGSVGELGKPTRDVGRRGSGRPSPELVLLYAAAARSAAALQLSQAAHRAAAHALIVAEEVGAPDGLARACCAAAFTALAAGDGQAVAHHVNRALDAARLAHDPLRALRARLLLAEAERRGGRPERAQRLLARMRRLPRGALPACLQVRITLLRGLVDDGDPDVIGNRIAATSGFAAIRLFAPARVPSGTAVTRTLADVQGLLAAMHTAVDEPAALVAMCRLVRRQLGAAGVVCVMSRSGDLSVLAADGVRGDIDLARACGAVRTVIGDLPGGHRVCTVPLSAGGRPVGALIVRWQAEPASPAAAVAWIELAAAACAPVVASAAARLPLPAAPPDLIIGASASMQAIGRQIERAARAPYPVLIHGESGTGKELVARAVHRRSARGDRPCCAVNCAALTDDLVEAELFGHARGAFTGAVAERAGVFEEAHGGTLLLDEVGELSPRAQAKLLRTLQEGEVRRLGENRPRRVDVRIIAATNRDLRADVSAGRFRLDLLYRLDVVHLALPPLRDRAEDIPLLAERFWAEAASRVRSTALLSGDTLAALARYDWPGNVRELQNVIAALAVNAPQRGVIWPALLPPAIGGHAIDQPTLDAARRTSDERCVRTALAHAGGHRGRAARALGVSRQGLTKLILRLGLVSADASCQPARARGAGAEGDDGAEGREGPGGPGGDEAEA